MSPFSNGNIRQQEVEARNHARREITLSLSKEAQETRSLVSALLGKILDRQAEVRPVDDLWETIQNSSQLSTIKSRADVNAADYPEFSRWVAGQRRVIANSQKKRIEEIVGPKIDQQRFANTKGLHG